VECTPGFYKSIS